MKVVQSFPSQPLDPNVLQNELVYPTTADKQRLYVNAE